MKIECDPPTEPYPTPGTTGIRAKTPEQEWSIKFDGVRQSEYTTVTLCCQLPPLGPVTPLDEPEREEGVYVNDELVKPVELWVSGILRYKA